MSLHEEFAKMDYFEALSIEAIWREQVEKCKNVNNTGTTCELFDNTSLTNTNLTNTNLTNTNIISDLHH